MNTLKIVKRKCWINFKQMILAVLGGVFLFGLTPPAYSYDFPQGKVYVGGEMTHRYSVTGTTTGPGRAAIQRVIDQKNEELSRAEMPNITLLSDSSATITVEFDHVRDMRNPPGYALEGSNREQLRVVHSVFAKWAIPGPPRFVAFIFDTILRSNNPNPPSNNELAAIERQIKIGRLYDDDDDEEEIGKAGDPNYRVIKWNAESLTDRNRWYRLKSKFTYDLDAHLPISHPDPISWDTHVQEINVMGLPIDILFSKGTLLFGFDRRYQRVTVPAEETKKLKLKVSNSNPDIQTVFDHTEWNAIREEVFTSATFKRIELD